MYCGYSLEPPQRVPIIYVLSKIMKMVKKSNENLVFTAMKNRCILHGRVFVMNSRRPAKDDFKQYANTPLQKPVILMTELFLKNHDNFLKFVQNLDGGTLFNRLIAAAVTRTHYLYFREKNKYLCKSIFRCKRKGMRWGGG